MRHRWIFPTALSALAIAALAALLFWPETPALRVDCKLAGVPNEAPFMASPGECATAHAITEQWRARRADALPGGGISGVDRPLLEACRAFLPAEVARKVSDATFCINEPLLHLYANWLDWPLRSFQESTFRDGNDRALLSESNLLGANFTNGGDASGIGLHGSILFRAKFAETNLQRAHFTNADLRGAELRGVNLGGAIFAGADLDGVLYEPLVAQLPDLASLAAAQNLQGLRWVTTPQQLNELREAFYKAGLPFQGQQITFAIERSRRVKEGQSPDWLDRLSSWGRRIAFEWTAAYGLRPFQPLLILVGLIPLFAPFYLWGLYGGASGHLWIRRPDKPINRPSSARWLPLRHVVRGDPAVRLLRHMLACLWFSTMCAFRIGYRDVNVGDWITRLQPREYLLGATGWCRSVSGVQSLVSVYLLALTVLCIIGRPFG